jgi:hypothetical protein
MYEGSVEVTCAAGAASEFKSPVAFDDAEACPIRATIDSVETTSKVSSKIHLVFLIFLPLFCT